VVTNQKRDAPPGLWEARAGVAERAVLSRHVRRVWGLPNTVLGVTRWPPTIAQRLHTYWHYWWQAHLLDCAVDAGLRVNNHKRRTLVAGLVRGVRLRNLGGWTNGYFDDAAWLGLALHRASTLLKVPSHGAVEVIAAELREGWSDHAGGGLWWRRDDDFKNVPANGTAAILFARLAAGGGHQADLQRAKSIVAWIEEHLVDQDTGLAWDGLHVDFDGSVRDIEKTIYTYCQGVLLGAYVELAGATGEEMWLRRAGRTIDAVATNLVLPCGVLRGEGGGDGGLFAGILARYLGRAAVVLPSLEPASAPWAQRAGELVLSSAEAAWRNRTVAPGGPLFGPDWTVPAAVPPTSAPTTKWDGTAVGEDRPERDLSVQLAGWMVLEAAATLEHHRALYP
jgi:predicted alpha-1,6-mannanase (GH76 family)